MVNGVLQFMAAFSVRRWSGFLIHLLIGSLYVVTALLTFINPTVVAASITLLLAVAFLVEGIIRLIVAVSMRFHNWKWAGLGGVITAGLGLVIWNHWPVSGLWVIGASLGIEMLLSGVAMIMFAFVLKNVGSGDQQMSRAVR